MILCEEDHSFGLKVTLLVLILLVLTIALPASDQEFRCNWCCFESTGEPQAWWGGKPFCSEMCKDSFWEKEKARTRRCKFCGIHVDPPSSTQTTYTGDMVIYTYGNTWDGYCDYCRTGIREKRLDPARPQYQFEPQYRCPPEEKPAPPPPPPEPAPAAGTDEGGAGAAPSVAKGVDATGKGTFVSALKFAFLAAAALIGFYYWRRA